MQEVTQILHNLNLLCSPHPSAKAEDWQHWLEAWRDPLLCPRCGSALIERNSKRGAFLGCNGYPHCKHTQPAQPRPQIDTNACQTCRRGRFVWRTSQNGERYGRCNVCRSFSHARYLKDAEKPLAAADRKAKQQCKQSAKAREAERQKARQRELEMPQLPVAGFDYSEWGAMFAEAMGQPRQLGLEL